MKKILPMILVGILILSGFGAVAINVEKNIEMPEVKNNLKSATISFHSEPKLQEKNDYLTISLNKANAELSYPGEPVLPVYVKSFQLSAKAININVQCTVQVLKTIDVTSEIIPGSKCIPLGYNDKPINTSLEKNEKIYSSNQWYPIELYDFKVTCGRNENNVIVNFVDICINTVRYSPGNRKLQYVSGNVDVKITYDVPIQSVVSNDESYDLVIIAPDVFTKMLKRLVNHKNKMGMDTILKTVEEICQKYEGRDQPEQIKYFIKDAIEEWNITYVLLVGGLKSYQNATDREDRNQGSIDWHIPVRYTNIILRGDTYLEPGCPSDLYYADIYKAGQEFDDWDSNDDDVFAARDTDDVDDDILDLRPDVYVGRLACRNKLEVIIMMNKIINYEKRNNENTRWFKRMICVAGKTHDIHDDMPDGEFVCEQSLEYMGDRVKPVRVYVSNNGTLFPKPKPNQIALTISRGAGFVSFQGHGNPLRWDTIWEDGEYPYDWAGGLIITDFIKFLNFRKLPVVVIGGCHNGLFNVTLVKTNDTNLSEFYWTHGSPTPVCFAWGLCIVPYGGAIASIAGTGLGIGWVGQPISLSSELETNFFYKIGQDNAETFGQAHSGAINKYITENPGLSTTEYHCITIYQPLGDPSLMLGGYP